jgi:hypothetical protein
VAMSSSLNFQFPLWSASTKTSKGVVPGFKMAPGRGFYLQVAAEFASTAVAWLSLRTVQRPGTLVVA